MKDIKTLKKMFYQVYSMLDPGQRRQMVVMFFITLLGSLLELLGVSAMLPFIQALVAPEELLDKPYISAFSGLIKFDDPQSVLVFIGFGIILIYIIKNVYLSYVSYAQAAYCNNTQKSLSLLLFDAYMTMPYSFFTDTNSGEIIRGLTGDVESVYYAIYNAFKLITELLVVLFISIYLIKTDFVMASGVIIIGIVCILASVVGLKKKISSLAIISREGSVRKNKWALETIGGIKEILVRDCPGYFKEGFKRASDEVCKSNTIYFFVSSLPERIIEALCVSGIIVTVLIRLKLGVDMASFVPAMAVFAMGAFRMLPSISRVSGYINSFVFHRPMVEMTYERVKLARQRLEELRKHTVVTSENAGNIRFNEKIDIDSVYWRYPDSKEDVLSGLSLEIKKGDVIGIIGESGAGKSTLADILLMLYTPQKGLIALDGMDISTIKPAWPYIIGYVSQSVFLMDDTIRENITFGRSKGDDKYVWNALEQASLSTFIRSLPDGLDTRVGERGVKLSGGQRQRIAIARALYLEPKILVLDEATSALDNETEDAVMEAIDNLAGKITLLIIAHRVTTLKGCNRIYEIKDGVAVERRKDEVISI